MAALFGAHSETALLGTQGAIRIWIYEDGCGIVFGEHRYDFEQQDYDDSDELLRACSNKAIQILRRSSG